MKFKVEIGVCWAHGQWTLEKIEVEAASEEDAAKMALEKCLDEISSVVPYPDAIAHTFVYSIQDEDEDDCGWWE